MRTYYTYEYNIQSRSTAELPPSLRLGGRKPTAGLAVSTPGRARPFRFQLQERGMCIHIYICMYIYIYIYTHMYLYLSISLCLSLRIYIYIYHINMHLSLYLYLYLSISLSLYIYIYIYTHNMGALGQQSEHCALPPLRELVEAVEHLGHLITHYIIII